MATVIVRIRQEGVKGAGSFEYKNEIPLHDNKLMAILFSDFERYGANLEKIYAELKKQKQAEFPF